MNKYFAQDNIGLSDALIAAIATIPPSAIPYMSNMNQNVSTGSAPLFSSVSVNNGVKLVDTVSGFHASLVPASLSANRIITFPNFDLDLTHPTFTYLKTSVGTTQHHIMMNGLKNRWAMELHGGDPDNGTNTGADLLFRSYADTGLSQSEALKINRNTGYTGLRLGSSDDPLEVLQVNGNIRADGYLKMSNSTFTTSLEPTTLTANHHIYIPNADVDLQYCPSQLVNTTSTPQFAKVGIGLAAGSYELDVAGTLRVSYIPDGLNYIGMNAHIDSPLTIGTNLRTGTSNVLSTMYNSASNQAGDTAQMILGVNSTSKNAGYLGFNYTASASNSNYVGLGIKGSTPVVKVFADGSTTITGALSVLGAITPVAPTDISASIIVKAGGTTMSMTITSATKFVLGKMCFINVESLIANKNGAVGHIVFEGFGETFVNSWLSHMIESTFTGHIVPMASGVAKIGLWKLEATGGYNYLVAADVGANAYIRFSGVTMIA
jgi:hypothetical protein